jgi:hypothetical protein
MNSKTIALLFAIFSLGGMVIPGLTIAQTAYAQVDVGAIIDEATSILDEEAEEEEVTEDDSNTQTIEQPIDQDIDQEVDQEEENEQDNDNTQAQVADVDQAITQGIVDGDDKAESESESGDAKGKHSSSSSSSGDAENSNEQEAENNADIDQDQEQTVTQTNTANFGDDTATLEAANVAIPIAVPINVEEEEEQPPEDGEDGEDGEATLHCVTTGQAEPNEVEIFLTAEDAAELETVGGLTVVEGSCEER